MRGEIRDLRREVVRVAEQRADEELGCRFSVEPFTKLCPHTFGDIIDLLHCFAPYGDREQRVLRIDDLSELPFLQPQVSALTPKRESGRLPALWLSDKQGAVSQTACDVVVGFLARRVAELASPPIDVHRGHALRCRSQAQEKLAPLQAGERAARTRF